MAGCRACEKKQHLVLLDQLPHLLDGLRRAVAVVAADEVDLAAIDAAVLIDHGEIGGFGLADGAVGRSRAAVRHGVADLDLVVAGAGSVLAGGESKTARENRPAAAKPFARSCLIAVMLMVMISSLCTVSGSFGPFRSWRLTASSSK